MRKTTKQSKTREGYEVGARPPELSAEAERRLLKLKVSPKLTALMEKARKAKVTRLNGTTHQECDGVETTCPTTTVTGRAGDGI